MTYTPPEDRHGWQTATSDGPPSHDGLAPQAPEPGGRRTALLAAVGGVVALVVVAVVMLASASSGDGARGGGGGGADVGGALATATTTPSNAGSVRDDTSPSTTSASDTARPDRAPAGTDLSPVTIPSDASAPTTIPGSEPSSVPVDVFSGEEAPLFGHVVVDLEPGGYQDFAVHLRVDQEIQLLSLADDGIETEIEVFAPDGSSEGWWAGGEPGVVNGLEWYLPDEPLPATGTYVIRVIHTGGSHDRFVLGFFGNA